MIGFDGDTPLAIQGRFQAVEGGRRLSWSGSSVTVRFRGRAVSADLTELGQNEYLVLVDGRPLRNRIVPAKGRSTVELVKGLDRGEHTVTLYKLTEPLVGDMVVHGFVLDDSAEPLPPPPRKARRILLIGDSISTGYGNEGKDQNESFSPDTQNHFLTYGARAARELDAELTTVAWSGKGVFSNRGTREETMLDLWQRAIPTDPTSTFEESPPPDVVLVNLGTNDFAPEEKDPTSGFGPAYTELVGAIERRYPNAALVLLVGPLLTDDPPAVQPLSTVRSSLKTLIGTKKANGAARIALFEFERATPEEGWGSDYHPSLRTHLRMAGQLTEVLRRELSW